MYDAWKVDWLIISAIVYACIFNVQILSLCKASVRKAYLQMHSLNASASYYYVPKYDKKTHLNKSVVENRTMRNRSCILKQTLRVEIFDVNFQFCSPFIDVH